MNKKGRRIVAILLALVLICQPSWSSIAPDRVYAEENESGTEQQDIVQEEQDLQSQEVQQDQQMQEEAQEIEQEEAQRQEELNRQRAEQEQQAQKEQEAQKEILQEKQQAEAKAEEKLSAPQPQSDAADFKGVLLEKIELSDEDQIIQAGESFEIYVTWKNTLDEAAYIGNTYVNLENSSGNDAYTYNTYNETEILPGESQTFTVTVDTNKYAAPESYTLYNVYCYGYLENGESNLLSDYYTNGNYTSMGEVVPEELAYEYNGEADYVIFNNGVVDDTSPVITGVTLDTNETGTYGEVTATVSFVEEISGIKDISLEFTSENTGETEWGYWTLEEGEEGLKTGSVEVKLKSLRELDDEYYLSSASISDSAGHYHSYNLTDDEILWGSGENDTFPSVSFQVTHEDVFPVVLIESIAVEGADKDNLSAGDSFDLIVTLKNNMDYVVKVRGDATWENSDMWLECDERISILPGESGQLRIPVSVNRYAPAGARKLEGISYTVFDNNDNHLAYAEYIESGYTWYPSDSSGSILIPESMRYEYTGQADYTVTNAPNADTEAPAITGISVKEAGQYEASVGTFDEIEVLVDYQEDLSGVAYVSLEFASENGNDTEWFTIYESDTSEGFYTGEGTFAITSRQVRQLGDVYQLSSIYIYDYAGNSTSYYVDEDQMVQWDQSGEPLPRLKYTVDSESPLDYVLIEKLKLVDENGNPVDNTVSAGDSFYLAATLRNNTEETVYVTGFGSWYSEGETEQTWTDMNSVKIEPDNQGEILIPVETSKYSRGRTWQLTEVYYNIATDRGHSGYGSLNIDLTDGWNYYGYSEGDEYFNLPIDQIYQYEGEADYVIVSGPDLDETAPVITGVTINDEKTVNAETGTVERLEAVVHYTEEDSGIRNMTLVFSGENGAQETFILSDAIEEQYTGSDAVLRISSRVLRALGDTYSLAYVSVTDYAGNTTIYNQINGDRIESESGEGFAQSAYTVVEESDYPMLIPTGIRIEGEGGTAIDRNQLSAGDRAELVLEVENTLEETVNVDAYARWYDTNGASESINQWRTLSVGQSEIRIPFEVSLFSERSRYTLDYIDLTVYTENNSYSRTLSIQIGSGEFTWSDREGDIELPDYGYAGEGDYTVAVSDTPDTEAPYLSSMKAVTDPVSAPGEIEFEIKADTGAAGITGFTVQLIDTEASENQIYTEPEDLYYSPQRQCYVLKVSLPDTTLIGTYELNYVNVQDEAGRSRDYWRRGDVMADNTGVAFENLTINVSESAVQGRDFEEPVISDFYVESKEVTLPGKITYIIEGTDESGIGSLSLAYRNKTTGRFVYYYADAEYVTGNQWSAQVDLGRYALQGEYELYGVNISDTSPQANMLVASRGDGGLDLSKADVVITGQKDTLYVTVDGTETEQLQSAVDGQTVIFTAGYSIEPDVMEVLKDKKLQAVFTSVEGEAEVLIDGSKLTDAMTQSWMQIEVGTENLRESESGTIWFENGYDRMSQYYYVYFYSEAKIPYTVRWKVDDRLLERADETGNARLSVWGEKGAEIEEERIQFTSDGYYEKGYPEGHNGYEEMFISTDTVKYFDHPLTVTATPSFTSDTITKGSSFDVELSVTNDNNTDLADVAVFALYNEEEQCPWYTFESQDSSVDVVGGDALIGEFKAGQTVKLTAKFSVPEDTEMERVPLTFVACSITDDEQIISYGDTEIRITLQDKLTLLKGDINADGIVNSGDLAYMLQVVNKRIEIESLTQEQIAAGDVNSPSGEAQGTINSGDLSKLLQFVNGRISSLD